MLAGKSTTKAQTNESLPSRKVPELNPANLRSKNVKKEHERGCFFRAYSTNERVFVGLQQGATPLPYPTNANTRGYDLCEHVKGYERM